MLTIPALKGTIARRILVNYRADPEVVQALLPHPFRPKLHQSHAIVGICLIRLENIRPAGSPIPCGLASENAAHRIAVQWNDADGEEREGVYIPRRDTDSGFNHLAGGRLFPGQHNLADFRVQQSGDTIDFRMKSRDEAIEVKLKGTIDGELPITSCFSTLADASAFFEGGSLGYSVRCDSDCLDGITLRTMSWRVETLGADDVFSSYYSNETLFPAGSVEFDHVLIMRDIEHEWHAAPALSTREPEFVAS